VDDRLSVPAAPTATTPATSRTAATPGRAGFLYGAAAYGLWGLFPLYWPLLKPARPLEILAHRLVWSLVFVALLLWRGRAWPSLLGVVRRRDTRYTLMAAGALVSVNWGTYIWAVNAHHVVETSLGYFINPLFTILLGVFVLHEQLRRVQWIAVGIASAAIVVLTVDYGRLPWIALTLAFSFGTYGYLKKRASVGAVESLAVETATMVLPALITLTVLQVNGELTFGHQSVGNTLLLMATGLVTAIPLLFFGAAARRLPLSVLGMLQYLAPVLQFAVGVLVDHEPMPAARWAGFGLVWLALILLTVDGLRTARAAVPSAVGADTAAV
jgi:chloramphenicol-sensitive protein RarD